MKGNGPSLAVSGPHLIQGGNRGNAFINNHSLLSNRLCSSRAAKSQWGGAVALSSEQQGAVREKSRPAASMSPAPPSHQAISSLEHWQCQPSPCSRREHSGILRGEGHGQVSTDSGGVTQIFCLLGSFPTESHVYPPCS